MKKSSNLSLNETPPAYGGVLDVELPEWSGQSPSRHAGSKEKWIEYCRSHLPKLRKFPGHAARRLEHGVAVEFHF